MFRLDSLIEWEVVVAVFKGVEVDSFVSIEGLSDRWLLGVG